MKKYIIIEADTNDADYISKKSIITLEQIQLIRPVVKAIKQFIPYAGDNHPSWAHLHDHNFPLGDVVREDLGERSSEELYGHLDGYKLFERFCPWGEYGIHTIVSVDIVYEGEKLL